MSLVFLVSLCGYCDFIFLLLTLTKIKKTLFLFRIMKLFIRSIVVDVHGGVHLILWLQLPVVFCWLSFLSCNFG
jgi:hypothetical protein